MKSKQLILFHITSLILLGSYTGCDKDQPTAPANNPPVIVSISSNPSQISKNQTCTLTVAAVDADGDNLEYSWSSSGGIYPQGNNADTVVWQAPNSTGNIECKVSVSDGQAVVEQGIFVNVVLYEYTQPPGTDDGWKTASLENVGLDPACFERLITRLLSHVGHEEHLIHGIVVVRNGFLVFEHYFEGLTHPTWGETRVRFDRDRVHVSSSVTKSFTAALLGIAIESGFISSADAKVFDFYPELAHLSKEQKQNISLRHLVTMSSGLVWDEWSTPLGDPNNDLTSLITLALNTDEDLIGFILGKNIVEIPGTVFNYSGGNTNVLGNIIQRVSGLRLDEFAKQYLFDPLGIKNSWWWLLRSDFVYASGDLALRPRDMAKFGQLFLQNGWWNGEQIVTEEWVTLSSTPQFLFTQYPDRSFRGYSYGWWPSNDSYGQGAYAASGWGGQEIIVLPEYDMVVVFTGGSYWEAPSLKPHEMMVEYVLPSIH